MRWVGICKSELIDLPFGQEFIGCFSPLHQVVASLDIFNNIMHLLSVMIFVTQEDHQRKTHASDAPSLCPVRPMHPESVPNARTPLLRPELRSNHPLHLDLTSSLLSISELPDSFNSSAPSGSHQDYHTPTPSLLA